ncbi:MAG: dihydropteroate synthase [Burkholderiaceae bacterium]
MGIVNVTPDSFSDGGRHNSRELAIAHAHRLLDEGADILDLGGESTRPGAPEVSAADEADRVLPVLEALVATGVPISIDTSKPALMKAALAAGAAIINDVRALTEPGAVEAVAQSDCGVVLMHMQGRPRTMQLAPHYADMMAEVVAYLGERCEALEAVGVGRDRIALDPGFGFGKTPEQNFRLVARAADFAALGCPLLIGLSRKSSLGAATGRDVQDRLAASLAGALMAVQHGARVVRVHDVAATVDALKVWRAIEEQKGNQA